MAKLTNEQILQALNETLESVHHHKEAFAEIRVDQRAIHERWQAFMGIFLPLQLEIVGPLGFTKDQPGLFEFNRQVSLTALDSKEVAKAKKDLWDFLLKTSFGITEFPTLTLDEAKSLMMDITDALISEFFLAKVDVLRESFTPDTTLQERQKKLTQLIVPLQTLVMRRYGFEGDLGYIRAQRALSDHTHDPLIKEQLELGYHLVFERAGLTQY
jgi:hypothetical protein